MFFSGWRRGSESRKSKGAERKCCLGVESLEGRDALSGMGILAPAYIYPEAGGAWTQLAEAARTVPVTAIMNPNSGPYADAVTRDAYAAAVGELRGAGGKVIGYVPTDYARRGIEAVKADIDTYRNQYQIDGIFIDEMTNTDTPQNLSYYKQIYDYVHGVLPAWTVVGNPGSATPESYVTNKVADTLVLFERESGFGEYTAPAWQAKYAAGQFANLALNIATATLMESSVARAASQNTGWIYVTNDNTSTADQDPWDTLPTYWNQLVSAVAAATPTRPMAIATSSLPQGTVNGLYNQTIAVSGGTGVKSFVVSAGTLPSGLSLSSTTGIISGTPKIAGNFSFTIRVTDSVGVNASKAFSMVINPAAAVIPSAPTTFNVTAVSGSRIDLYWSDVASETGYRVYRWTGSTWQVLATVGANVTSYANTGLSAGTTYYYYVEAFNSAGKAQTGWKSAMTLSAPPAPASFTATAVSSSRINLSWSASAGSTGYRVYRWTGSGWVLAATLGSSTISYAATGLSAKTTYFFYVEALNSIGATATGWKSAVTF